MATSKPAIPKDDAIRLDMVARLSEASKRWRQTGTLQVSLGNADGHDCIRLSRRLAAMANALRSKAYRERVPAKLLRDNWRKTTLEISGLIEGCMPGGKIPGYVERA